MMEMFTKVRNMEDRRGTHKMQSQYDAAWANCDLVFTK